VGDVRPVLELILEETISPIAKRLPLLTYYGVSTSPAAIFSLMGVERLDAIRLGKAFLREGNTEVGIQSLKAWAKSVELEGILRILRGGDDREIDYETLNILRSE
jgi:hypothetical protein